MGFVSGSKSMPKSIYGSRGTPGSSLGKNSGNSLTTGIHSMGVTSESRSWTVTMDINNLLRSFCMLLDKK